MKKRNDDQRWKVLNLKPLHIGDMPPSDGQFCKKSVNGNTCGQKHICSNCGRTVCLHALGTKAGKHHGDPSTGWYICFNSPLGE